MRVLRQQKVEQSLRHLLRSSMATSHSRIVTCGLIAGFIYLPLWLRDVVLGTLVGAGSVLMLAALSLGFYLLWRGRRQLGTLSASAEDRLLGYLIIFGGIGLSPFCFSAEWSQKLVCMLILIGIACSSWGIEFFKQHPVPTFLIGLGLFPNAYAVGHEIWQTFTPPLLLERLMAWAGTLGLQAIGQPAVADGTVIALPAGAVKVEWACNGFNMAAEIAVASLVLGLFLKQNLPRLTLLVVTGMVLALLLNVPRIMLMAMAEAYWGKASFDFWHGLWGGQIFSTILFTIYYYVVMAIVKGRSGSKSVSSS
ncbi:MAG: hypothetical protein Kow00121_09050 [Elainellaceae cyanobacterium]